MQREEEERQKKMEEAYKEEIEYEERKKMTTDLGRFRNRVSIHFISVCICSDVHVLCESVARTCITFRDYVRYTN